MGAHWPRSVARFPTQCVHICPAARAPVGQMWQVGLGLCQRREQGRVMAA